MTAVTENDLSALSKPELLRLVQRMRHRSWVRVEKTDVLEVQHEEAWSQAQAAFDASIAMTGKVDAAHSAALKAIQACSAARDNGGNVRKAINDMEAASAAASALQAEKDKLWATYERLDRRAAKLRKQLDAEWERGRERCA